MSGVLPAVRRSVLTPSTSSTKLDRRGFFVKSPEAQELLETVGRAFLAGYRYAAGARSVDEVERDLGNVDRELRGFAYEGAAMAFTIRDALRIRKGHHHVGRFLAGPASPHVYMAHVGIGGALARLPRRRWPAVAPRDQLLGWLAMDGFGFHQAFFHTDRYVHQQYQDRSLRWPPGETGHYVQRAVDQGIGRALWFVEGAEPDRVATVIDKFAPGRQADLWSGAGLAATYAGGATEAELRVLSGRAGEFRPVLAQGCAFAAKARLRANLITEHVRMATELLCGLPLEEAAAVTDQALVDLPTHAQDADLPSYETWRRRIADILVSRGR